MHKFGSYFPQTYLYQHFIAKTGQDFNQNEIKYPQAHLSSHLIWFAAGARKQDQKLSRMKIKTKRWQNFIMCSICGSLWYCCGSCLLYAEFQFIKVYSINQVGLPLKCVFCYLLLRPYSQILRLNREILNKQKCFLFGRPWTLSINLYIFMFANISNSCQHGWWEYSCHKIQIFSQILPQSPEIESFKSCR